MAIANNKKYRKYFILKFQLFFCSLFIVNNEGFLTMEIKKNTHRKIFSREKNNRFPQNNSTIKSKKKRHETLAKNDVVMKKNA